MKNIYVDHAATTSVDKEVLESMLPFFTEKYGNPSSLYLLGRESKLAIDDAREKVAKAINAKKSEEIIFTSGGSESDNLAIKGVSYMRNGGHIITTKIEHHAILNACKSLEEEGYKVTYLNVDSNGLISLEELKNNIRRDTFLVSVMFANNEIGTIEPIEEIGKICRENNIIFHVDAVQAVGVLKVDVQKLNIDMLSMSSHKFYGPKGIGALYVREGIKLKQLINGGHQENNFRAGTENVPGIVGIRKSYRNFTEKFKK